MWPRKSDEIEFRVSKILYEDIYIKVYEHWSGGLVCASVSLTNLKSAIVANAFSSDLETHKSQNFHMVAPRGVAKHFTSFQISV